MIDSRRVEALLETKTINSALDRGKVELQDKERDRSLLAPSRLADRCDCVRPHGNGPEVALLSSKGKEKTLRRMRVLPAWIQPGELLQLAFAGNTKPPGFASQWASGPTTPTLSVGAPIANPLFLG